VRKWSGDRGEGWAELCGTYYSLDSLMADISNPRHAIQNIAHRKRAPMCIALLTRSRLPWAASAQVRDDVLRSLAIPRAEVFTQSFNRSNLTYEGPRVGPHCDSTVVLHVLVITHFSVCAVFTISNM